ncbi:MAG: hypothetical protein LBF93_06080 [Zoogloeaceae bacterium]|nr:hypothetical protein [Zoogloeaceae bacterium]
MTKRTNPEHPYELRDPTIIALLAGQRFVEPDMDKSHAMGNSSHVKPVHLKEYGDVITRALEAEPEYNALIAHARVFQASQPSIGFRSYRRGARKRVLMENQSA